MKTYKIIDNDTIEVFSKYGVRDYCKDAKIDKHDFNKFVIINESVTDCISMFSYFTSFNKPIDIPKSVVNCSSMFEGCYALNQPVRIPDSVLYCNCMFYKCKSFNQQITIPDSVTSCSSMFYGCESLNQSIVIPDLVTGCESMFYGCTSLNKPIVIPDCVIDCSSMFYGCEEYNHLTAIPSSVKYCDSMFYKCKSFNQPIIIPNTVVDYRDLLSNYKFFNQLVLILTARCDTTRLFRKDKDANNFYISKSETSTVLIPKNYKDNPDDIIKGFETLVNLYSIPENKKLVVIDRLIEAAIDTGVHELYTTLLNYKNEKFGYDDSKEDTRNRFSIYDYPDNEITFILNRGENIMGEYKILDNDTIKIFTRTGVKSYCNDFGIPVEEFNQPVIIDQSVTEGFYMFALCKSFNQSVVIPNGIVDCSNMFEGCESFNQPVVIPNSVTNCNCMFKNCKSLNQPVIIPNSAIKCFLMFGNCERFNQPVIIPESVINSEYMFEGCKSFNQLILILKSNYDITELFGYFYNPDNFYADNFYVFKSDTDTVLIPKNYQNNLGGITKDFEILIDTYSIHENKKLEIIDKFIEAAINVNAHELYITLLNYKRKNFGFKDSEDDITTRFSLDDDDDNDDNSVPGETSLF